MCNCCDIIQSRERLYKTEYYSDDSETRTITELFQRPSVYIILGFPSSGKSLVPNVDQSPDDLMVNTLGWESCSSYLPSKSGVSTIQDLTSEGVKFFPPHKANMPDCAQPKLQTSLECYPIRRELIQNTGSIPAAGHTFQTLVDLVMGMIPVFGAYN